MTDVVHKRGGQHAGDLDAKYREPDGSFYFTGVQALVRVPIDQMRADRDAGLNTATFISGYQGSPLGGYDRELIAHKKLLEPWNFVHVPGLNEELGATAVVGSQISATFPGQKYDGVLGVWYGKAPGLDRSGDAIRHAQYGGTTRHGGVLALVGDDPACKSSTLPSSSEWSMADLHIPTLQPGNVQESLDLGLHGIAISRLVGLWTGMKIVSAVADGTATIEVGPGRFAPVLPELIWNGKPYRPTVEGNVGPWTSGPLEKEIFEARIPLAEMYASANNLNRITVDPPQAWIGIVASGRCYYETLEALHLLGLSRADLSRFGIRLLQLGMLYPLERDVVRRFAQGLEEIVVVEEKRPFIETYLRDALYGMTNAPRILGKRDHEGALLVPGTGALDADYLVDPLRRRLAARLDSAQMTPATPSSSALQIKRKIEVLPNRTPYFCSGCPHSTSTKVPEGSLVGSGIGCHGLVVFLAPERVGQIMGGTQMGGEGVQWIGVAPFVETEHFIQNIGDGTFAHSGSLAIRQAVAADANMTFKLLYNSAVAMTGGQDAAGAMPVDRLSSWALCEGVKRVIITTDELSRYRGVKLSSGVEVWDRSRIVEAQEVLAKIPGVTLLIHDQQCAAEKRRDRKRGNAVDPARRVVINQRVCEGCGDCGVKSNCLSVQPVDTEFGRKTAIHQSSCNKDYSCLEGDCPSFLTVVPKKSSARSKKATRAEGGARRRPTFDLSLLPEPTPIVPTDNVTLRMPGVGGTGVVTVAQIVGTAATLDGKHVGGLDQTGLSQKAGPVVSDVHISSTPIEGTNKITAGGADLYLVFDLLVGLSPGNLVGVSPARTVAVVSTSKSPTGLMVRDTSAVYPNLADLQSDMNQATRAADNRFLDTIAVTEALFGESTTANIFQLGIAYQLGALPVSAGAIESAIELNGAAVEANKLAFRWGRLWAVDPARVREHSVFAEDYLPKPTQRIEEAIVSMGLGDGELGRIVRLRAGDLVVYQNEKYARSYLDVVKQGAGTDSIAFAEAVARGLYRLMAYKDEYEVARLHLEEGARAEVENAVGANVKVYFNFHPPLLRSLGMKNKIALGPWARPILGMLRAGRGLRGTWADPFGKAEVRRVERGLINEYVSLIGQVSTRVNDGTVAAAVELAGLPELVRGYEQIKLRTVEHYRSELARLRSNLGLV
ncbi:MAG: indolepyruvate ferredoxin oxidoreductase family protein [Actinobacteria bacterium]|uniref:Unannotated protein n=1 Tax=freshwater metagenome TaxID=449393 RepID=A0A6J7MBD8_9ZZZZ|nr:indolepyruvate ferredoxin oxidoreductase family protein [Actinomycetota bacterium]